MGNINFRIIHPDDNKTINLIAKWYLIEWNIPVEKMLQRLKTVTADNSQFQVLMTLDEIPIATAGLYNHVGLINKEPRFNIYKNWLALVYTIPEKRGRGFGALICNYIQDCAKRMGIEKMYLYTDTAERFYKRLGWVESERLIIDNRNIVVMEKNLIE